MVYRAAGKDALRPKEATRTFCENGRARFIKDSQGRGNILALKTNACVAMP
jgi:hypothetical protein